MKETIEKNATKLCLMCNGSGIVGYNIDIHNVYEAVTCSCCNGKGTVKGTIWIKSKERKEKE
ncbi:MAG: hypothetical protein ACRC0V_05155 [Fusobacteriaceae bacterium]